MFRLLLLVVHAHTQSTNDTINSTDVSYNSTTDKFIQWSFNDYLQKYNPTRVFEDLTADNTRRGLNKEIGDDFDVIYERIDDTDELLSLKVPNGDPKVIIKDGRRWEPPGDISTYKNDRFSLNRRFLELMKQAIYQARNKMVIMQAIRPKYNKMSLYKMGFLMSKTDQSCKTYARYTHKAFMGCYHTRLRFNRYPLIELLQSYERSINLWFETELLIDLIEKNDQNCERTLNQVLTNRKESWKFVD